MQTLAPIVGSRHRVTLVDAFRDLGFCVPPWSLFKVVAWDDEVAHRPPPAGPTIVATACEH